MEARRNTINVLMLPWLAHGHISPFLELAKRLVYRNFHIHLCSTAVNLTSIKKKIPEKFTDSIQLVELTLPSSPELPPPYHTTNGLPPHLMTTLKEAFEESSPNLSNILDTVKPQIVMYDYNQPWVAELASSRGISAVQFLTVGATIACYNLFMDQKPDEAFPFPEIYLRQFERIKIQELCESQVGNVKESDRAFAALTKSKKIVLIKTSREIEGKYIDFMSILCNKKIVPVGTLVQDPVIEDENKEIMEWLDKKEKNSVVFVSFGSEYFLSKEERLEVAKALELSQVNFVWVIRFPLMENIKIEEALPQGFLEKVGDRGLVVEGWAPQAKILGHPSIGGFVSHCGWSSTLESMKFGVPIIAMPMQIDQPFNARVVEAIGVGVEAFRDENGKLQDEEIAKAIRKIILDKSREEIRKRSKRVSEDLDRRGEEEINGVVEELVALCVEKIGQFDMIK
ncbi:beta-D-glucosyl crocetin beta-1,6-glucosyltransferase-like [Olea europaea var. sylvestris]|uniref:beta-D-glucosyl crocetin beta-1,6-glucosyltransferase-like n=1 Tax=Olea europaea var. sylvestris TaxID=158386 RepID=UPI000C1D32E4|nr:beta-D-glucosyl crocetin beta-1,6-glucosyltransferase-like [Olea europaea var. sylvestris]